MSAYVFLGPSLSLAEAREQLDATFLPPIQQGDLLRLLDVAPQFVGIVDGYFETIPSVWHKEILYAMSRGVHVFGAASMGALRAAELHAFGMIGVGTVFQWYCDGTITRDDEVAVVHGPPELEYVPMSDSLVDIRDCCNAAIRDGLLDPPLAERLVATAGSLPFQRRTYNLVVEQCRADGADCSSLDDWLEYTRKRGTGLKGRDTLAMLKTMQEFASTFPPRKQVAFVLERTTFFEHLLNEVRLARAAGMTMLASDADAPLRYGETRGILRKRMLIRLLAREVGERLGWSLDPTEVTDYASRFLAQFGITEQDETEKWMASVSISHDTFWRFINDAILTERLERLHRNEIESGLPDQLRFASLRGLRDEQGLG